jgi:hypothetical protein
MQDVVEAVLEGRHPEQMPAEVPADWESDSVGPAARASTEWEKFMQSHDQK